MTVSAFIQSHKALVQWLPESAYKMRDVGVRILRGHWRQAYPLANGDFPTPFFLVGSGRSGSTLLRRMLSVSPSVYIPEETYFMRDQITQTRAGIYRDWSSYVDAMLAVIRRHVSWMQEPAFANALRCQCINVGQDKQSLATILDAFYRVSASASGRSAARWGDRTPMYTYSVEAICEVFPAGQFIHVLRDGIDVCASCVQSGLIATPAEAAYRWVSSVRRMRQFQDRHPKQVIVVRYEDLVTHPERELTRLCKFLDIDFVPDMTYDLEGVSRMGDVNRLAHHHRVQQPLSASSISKGRHSWPMETREQVAAIMNRELRRHDYADAVENAG